MPCYLILLALLCAGCGASSESARPAEGDATASAFRAMQVAEERVDLHSGPALDAEAACEDDCGAGREVCAGAREVCGLAHRLDDPDARRRCADARRLCDAARATAAPLCPCAEGLR